MRPNNMIKPTYLLLSDYNIKKYKSKGAESLEGSFLFKCYLKRQKNN